MALRNTAPRDAPLKATFNLVTQTGAALLRNLPFGGAVGVVAAGIVLWFAPGLVPAGWTAEAVLSLGMGSGVVLQRLVDGAFGWFLEPARRHLGARWEARIRLGKLEGYQKRGLLAPADAKDLTTRIVKDDLSPKRGKR
jgi:hypothetical protein